MRPIDRGNDQAIAWFASYFNRELASIEESFAKFRISEALMQVYKLVFDEFLRMVPGNDQPPYQQPVDKKTYNAALGFLEELLKVLHPFMPFITEEIWSQTGNHAEGDFVARAAWPQKADFDQAIIDDMEAVKTAVTNIRNIRNEKNIPFRDQLELFVKTENPDSTKSVQAS